MNRKLTTGEREVIAGALYRLANKRDKEADAILGASGFFQSDGGEPSEETNAKLEKLAATILGRYRALRKSAQAHANLGSFIAHSRHSVTVDCIVNIPEQF